MADNKQKIATKVTRVRAVKTGYYNGLRRGPDEDGNGGDVFTIKEGEPIGSWMEVMEDEKPPRRAPKKRTAAGDDEKPIEEDLT